MESRGQFEKESHNLVSQRGRAKINEQIEMLKALLPECQSIQVNKAATLCSAVKTIERNQLCIALFKRELAVEARQNAQLREDYEQVRQQGAHHLMPLGSPMTDPEMFDSSYIKDEFGYAELFDQSSLSEVFDSASASPSGYSPAEFAPSTVSILATSYNAPYSSRYKYEPPRKRMRNLIEPVVIEDDDRLVTHSLGMSTIIQPLEDAFDGPIIENIKTEPLIPQMTEIMIHNIVQNSDHPALKLS